MAIWSSTLEPTGANISAATVPEDEHLPSPAVSASVHADAVRLARWQVVVRLPFLLTGALLAVFVVLLPQAVLLWGPVAFALVAEYARTVIEWLNLRRIDPADLFQRERQQRGEERDMAAQISEHRARLSRARPLMTQGLLATVAAVTLVQFSMPGIERSIDLAALVKPAARAGEWWRLLSASYLHGSLLHAATNLSALVALGGLIELYDRRMRVPLVYLGGVAGGGLASLLFTPGPSLGASAGVLAFAGYLIMLGRSQAEGLPKWLHRQMRSLLVGTAIFGVVGFLFIDNAAHVGGVVAGLIVGRVAAPKRSTESSVGSRRAWDAAGWVASGILLGGAIFTIGRLMQA